MNVCLQNFEHFLNFSSGNVLLNQIQNLAGLFILIVGFGFFCILREKFENFVELLGKADRHNIVSDRLFDCFPNCCRI